MQKQYPSNEETIELILNNKPVEDKIFEDDIEIEIPESSEIKQIKFIKCDFENSRLIIKNNELNKNALLVSFLSCKFKKNQFTLEVKNISHLLFNYSEVYKETNLYLEATKCNIQFFNTTLFGNLNGFLSDESHLLFFGNKASSKGEKGKLDIGFIDSYEIKDSSFEELIISHVHKNKCLIKNVRCKSLVLEDCIHEKEFSLENCNYIDKLLLIKSSFEYITSFQNTSVKTIKLDKVSFNDKTYFDDFKVLAPKDCDRKTIRSIKQELQKTENRIDYDKFRGYELELYKEELKEKEEWWNGDLLILRLNSLFSRHGTSWKKALGMTFLFSLLFYTMLYGVERLYNKFTITEISFDHYTSGYFKFFLVTNFHDPLSEDKKYLSHFFEWFFFILGKITIGYGLFETVQSFRKYKK